MSFELPALPYALDALAPVISAETLEYHHGKHHNAYVQKLNGLIAGTEYEEMSLEDIISKSSGGLFNQAAQVWNHTFYFTSLSPNTGGEPSGKLGEAIVASFGSFDGFKEEFENAALGNFASGWTWLVTDGEKLSILNTDDADTPLRQNLKPLLTVDVWEHAYYIDYRNARGGYLKAIWGIMDWGMVAKRHSESIG